MVTRPTSSSLFPYTTLFRSRCFPAACTSGTRLDRSRSTLREIWTDPGCARPGFSRAREKPGRAQPGSRSEEHTSELQSRQYLVCRLLLEKKNNEVVYTIALR